jgi:hypothetical protein
VNSHLHIICQRVPWPPDDSRAIDIIEQLKLFYNHGVKVHLHYYCHDLYCHPTEVNRYCESIHPYKLSHAQVLDTDIEMNRELLASLQLDGYPILFEGLQCLALLKELASKGRQIIVRMYDDECRQADHLAREEKQLLRKIRLQRESRKMKSFEDSLPPNVHYIFSNRENAKMFAADHGLPEIKYLPLLHAYHEITSHTGSGNFFLYHGDLSDPFNEKAASWLLEKVFNDVKVNFVIAGKNPGKRIQRLGHLYAHSCLIVDPSPAEIDDLVAKAHGHVLPSFNYKRPELKLLHALHGGRHCIVNENAVAGTGLEPACYIANTANAFKSAILELHHKPFEEHEVLLRQKILKNEQEDASLSLMQLVQSA